MWLVIEDHDNLFVMAEVVHFLGIGLLAYKLTKKKNAGGALPCNSYMHNAIPLRLSVRLPQLEGP